MTFRFAEAFAGYGAINDTADSGWSNAGGCSYANNTGRFGLGGVTSNHGSTFTRGIVKVVANTDSVHVQFAAKFDAGARSNACVILRLKNNGGVNTCLSIKRTPSDGVQLLDANGAVVITSAAGILTPGVWHVILVSASIGDPLTGSAEVYVNSLTSNPVITESSIDLNGAGALEDGCDLVQFEEQPAGDNVAGQTWTLSELLIWDTEGALPWSQKIGDKRLYLIQTATDSAEIEWTPNGVGTHQSKVSDDLTGQHDGDSTYNSAAASDKQELFFVTPLPAGVVGIAGVISVLTAKKADGGAQLQLYHFGESTGAAQWDSPVDELTTVYKNYQFNQLKDPDGTVDWTEAAVNGMAIGYRSPDPA